MLERGAYGGEEVSAAAPGGGAGGNAPARVDGRQSVAPRGPQPRNRGAQTSPTPSPAQPAQPAQPAAEHAHQMLIYTANVHLVVDHVVESINQVVALAATAGGYLATRDDESVQIRVPVARFNDLMAQLEHLGDVAHREVQVEDVGAQFHDLEVQLANLRAVRARLQEFLNRAANVADALAVEHELERVGSEIDRIEGQIRYLGDRAAYSTITVHMIQRPSAGTMQPAVYTTPTLVLPYAWLDELGLPRLLESR
jgi:hypothetical protein